MFTSAYLVEILTPKRTDPIEAKDKINLFAERYYRVLDSGLRLSVPDNPMGQPRFSLLELHLPFDARIQEAVAPYFADPLIITTSIR